MKLLSYFGASLVACLATGAVYAEDFKVSFVGAESLKDVQACKGDLQLVIEKFRVHGSIDLTDLVISHAADGNDPYLQAMQNSSKQSILNMKNGFVTYNYCASAGHKSQYTVRFLTFGDSKQSNTLKINVDMTK